jgi:protoporphyrin/coproporphyrin ferrochelatase
MKRAILLLNLGGPENLDAVKPFLYRLFLDPEIIRIRFSPLRKLVAWLISNLRASSSRDLYKQIGGGSPIRELTDRQSTALEALLKKEKRDVSVHTAFQCSPPFIEDVMTQLSRRGVERVLAVPLYPQYSFTTSRGALDRVTAAVYRHKKMEGFAVRSYPTHPKFAQAHADLIRGESRQFTDPQDARIHLLFSAHSIPEKLVTREGDPYRDEVEASVAAIVKAAEWKGGFSLAWQSKLGPVKWLTPSTAEVIRELAKKKISQLLIVPVAFVSDHIETLQEIDILFREEARKAGIREFRRTRGLNDHPVFIECLADLALSQKDFWK